VPRNERIRQRDIDLRLRAVWAQIDRVSPTIVEVMVAAILSRIARMLKIASSRRRTSRCRSTIWSRHRHLRGRIASRRSTARVDLVADLGEVHER